MYWFPFFRPDATGHWGLSPLSSTRIFGVLQRIALGYLFASLMIYFFKLRATIIITVLILIAYWPIMMYFGDRPDPLAIQANAIFKLDTWMIGLKHMYADTYGNTRIPFEPEGLLSTFPAIGNVVGGYVVGKYVQEKGKIYEGLTHIMLGGFILLVIAHFWNYQFPINKKLWTSSFVLHTVGLDCLILSGVIYLIDFKQKTGRWTTFFETVGKNPLPVYLLSELLIYAFYAIKIGDKPLWAWLSDNIFSLATPYIGSLLQAICYMLICWSFGYWLNKNKWYLRV
jgi:predicted acyltransferase